MERSLSELAPIEAALVAEQLNQTVGILGRLQGRFEMGQTNLRGNTPGNGSCDAREEPNPLDAAPAQSPPDVILQAVEPLAHEIQVVEAVLADLLLGSLRESLRGVASLEELVVVEQVTEDLFHQPWVAAGLGDDQV